MSIEEKYLWVEKYRPKTLSEVVIPDEYRAKFESYLEDGEIPHLLFHGKPGTGKTTIARILVENLIEDRENLLIINGSDKTGVDTIRKIVDEFLKTPSFSDEKKIVWIEEADHLSTNAQACLRYMMEDYSDTGRIIFTANYFSKFIEPIVSRFQVFEFKTFSKEYIRNFCEGILKKENIEYKANDIEVVVGKYYPDIRKILNFIQSRSDMGIFRVENGTVDGEGQLHVKTLLGSFFDGIKNKDEKRMKTALVGLQKVLSETDLDYTDIYSEMFNSRGVPVHYKVLINDYSNKHMGCMIPQMNFMACLYAIVKMYKDYENIGEVR